MARNIEDLNLDEITQAFLLDECVSMGDELGVDTRQGSIYRDAAAGHIVRISKFLYNLAQVKNIISINTCTGEMLDEQMMLRGMKRNPDQATPAQYYAEFVGAEPFIGDRVVCDGRYWKVGKYDGQWVIISEDTGDELNNVVAGTIIIPERDIDGLVSASVINIAVQAVDRESDEDARERFIRRVSGPDENGNKSQVRTWCESVPGVGRARIFPLWNGPDTVKAVIISQDGRSPSYEIVQAVQEYIDPGAEGMGEGVATIGCHFTAVAAEQLMINISATLHRSNSEGNVQNVTDSVNKVIDDYLRELCLNTESDIITVRHSSITALIMQVEGVLDCENLLLNGEAHNIVCTDHQIPIFGEVKWNV